MSAPESPAPAVPFVPPAVSVEVIGPRYQRENVTVMELAVFVEGHTKWHYFELQRRAGQAWGIYAEIPGLPRTVLAHLCQASNPANAVNAIAASYQAEPAPGGMRAAAIAVSGLPGQGGG